MQKKIIALAIASAFAAPVAMADVTMYGSMDGGFRHQTNEGAAGTTDSMQMGQYNTARFGLKSVEDMGDGMKTTVVLETSLAPAGVGANGNLNGAPSYYNPSTYAAGTAPSAASNNPFGLLFDRQATIGVSAGWGSVDLGWNYTASFKTIVKYDPLGYKWLGQAKAKSSDYTDRMGSAQYNGKFGDVAVIGEYYVTDAAKAKQPQMGAGRAVGVSYDANGITVAGAYTAVEADTLAGYDDSTTHMTVGGGYSFGDGKVSVGYAKKSQKTTASDSTDTNMWLGGNYKVTGKTNVLAAYYSGAKNTGASGASDSTSKVMIVGVTYDLSKKTNLYFSADRTTTNTGASGAADVVSVGETIGLNTAF